MYRKISYLILFVTSLTLNNSINAKNLYVDGSIGNDTVSYANNSISSPWATIGRAAWGSTNPDAPNSSEAAQAGDTTFVSAGTYASSATWSQDQGYPLYSSANSGTSGNLIVYYATGLVRLQTNNNGRPVIGSVDRNYIEWNGFTIDGTECTLRPFESGIAAVGATGNRIVRCNLTSYYYSFGPGNNTNCIYVHTAINPYIGNNILYGSSGISGENNSAITMYNTIGAVYEYNTTTVVNSGFYFKAPQSGHVQENVTIRYNVFYGEGGSSNEPAIRLLTAEPDGANYSKIYQNLIYNCNVGISLTPITDEWRDIDVLHVVNNTIYNCTYGIQIGGGNLFDDNRVYNNIVTDCDYAMWSYGNDDGPNFRSEYDSDYNCWFNNNPSIFYLCNNNYSYAQWQSIFFNGLADANSLTLNPQFENPSNGLFQLQPSSPCSTGLDILDLDTDGQTNDAINMGCYVTGNEILGAGGSPINLPSKSFKPTVTR